MPYRTGRKGDPIGNKLSRISVRIDDKVRQRLDRALKDGKISEPDLIRACVEAACEYIEANGFFPSNCKIQPGKSNDKGSYGLNEK